MEIDRLSKIPVTNFNPHLGIIIKEAGNTTGWQYKEGILANYYMQIGADAELGLLQNLGPMVIAKKIAIGSWLDFIEKFGVPPRWVITDTVDKNRIKELSNMMNAMLTSAWSVLQGNEKIEIANVPSTNADSVFNLLIERCNSEISKRILGATGTMDEKSFVGSALVHQSMAYERHAADRAKIANIVNKLLIPRLISISSAYAKLQGHYFDFDETFEMEPSVLVEKAVSLSQYFDIDYEYISRRTGIPILGVKQSTGVEGGTPTEKKP
jgi:phage gp29-like protein